MRYLLAVMICFSLVKGAVAQEKSDNPILVLDSGGHTAKVTGVLFTPDGKEVITISYDKTIRIWDAETGDPIRVLRPPIGPDMEGALVAGAISPDGKYLAVGAFARERWKHGVIYLIELETGALKHTLGGHTSLISVLAFSRNSKLLASGAHDTTARIWNVNTGKCEQTLEGHERTIYGIDFSRDGKRIATASGDHSGAIWNVKTGKREVELAGHDDMVTCLNWSPDGKTIATGSNDQHIRLWSADGSYLGEFEKSGSNITSIAFMPNSDQLLFTASTVEDGAASCEIIELREGAVQVSFSEYSGAIFHGTLSPDGKLAATTNGEDDSVDLWNTANGEVVAQLAGLGRGLSSVGWSSDGLAVAWGNLYDRDENTGFSPLEHSFHLGDLEMGETPDESYRRAQHKFGDIALKVDRDDDKIVRVMRDKKLVASLVASDGVDGPVGNATLFPNNRAVVGSQRALLLFDTRTGKQLRSFRGHQGMVLDVAPAPDNRYFVSVGDDQTLCIWTHDRDDPLLALFFAGEDWIAWTPEGYYAASPAGEDLMGWHVNQGPDAMAQFYPASQFHKSLHRPDVIRLLLKTGDIKIALEEADQSRGLANDLETVADLLPPTILITSPEERTVETADATAEIRFLAKPMGSHPLTAVRLWVNGRPVPGPAGSKTFESPEMGEIEDGWTVRLAPGENSIVVKAESEVSVAESEAVTVNRVTSRGTRKIDASKLKELKSQQPSLYVLSIGVSDYSDPHLEKLNYCGKDAEAIGNTFQDYSKPLYKNVVVKTLADKQATRTGILRELDDMRKRMTADDICVFFFAGHGAVDKDGKFYLLPIDAELNSLLATGIPGVQLIDAFEGPRRVIVMLDACHSGAVSSARGTDGLASDLKREQGIIVMCSSRGREESLESSTEQHGYFTKALVEGLSGTGQDIRKNLNGEISVNQLNAYTELRVQQLSQGKQTPVFGMPQKMSSFSLTKP